MGKYRPIRQFLPVILVVIAVIAMLSAGGTAAQEIVPVEYGAVVFGTIPSDNAQVAYSFVGTAGDLVSVRVMGAGPGVDPNVALLGPAQEQLVFNENFDFYPGSTAAQVTYRLFVTGTYTVLISGTAGDFLLTLEVRPMPAPVALVFTQPTEVVVPLAVPEQVYAFNTDPFNATTLFVDADPFFLDAAVEVRNGTGQIVGFLAGDIDNACLSFGPGDDAHEVRVIAAPEAAGRIHFTLSNAPCELGPEPAPVVAVEQPPFEPVVVEGICAASSFQNVQIRLGPGLNYAVAALLLPLQPIQVLGISEDGAWYAVQAPTFIGFVPTTITFLTGPCDQLPVIQSQVQPADVTPTPGLPPATPTPAVTEATPEVTEPPAGATATPTPTQAAETPVGQPTATPMPTQAATATVAPETPQATEPTPEVTEAAAG